MGTKASKDLGEDEKKKGRRDVRLIVPDETGKMHTVVVSKSLLLQNSGVFRDLAEKGELKKGKKLKLHDVTVTGVLKILQCLEGTVVFNDVNEVSQTLEAADKYQISGIEATCLEHLTTSLNPSNVCDVYEFSVGKEFPDLMYKSLKVIDEEAQTVLKSESFLNLRQNSVVDIIKRNSLSVNSEKIVFEAVLEWGKAELRRQGQDLTNNLTRVLRPLLPHVRFSNMSPEELSDPLVSDYLPSSTSSPTDRKNVLPLGTSQRTSPGLPETDSGFANRNSMNLAPQPRCYVSQYVHSLEVFDSMQPAISNGESFCLTLEVLKGKVFLCGVSLALKKFSNRMNATCLYGMLCATNTRSGEQKKVRGTFLDTTAESSLMFSSPLYLKDNDTAELVVNVKMAGNTAPLCRKNDVEIIVPPNKDIAMKVLPSASPSVDVRCIFKDVMYFF